MTETNTGRVSTHVSSTTNFTLYSLHPYYSYAITIAAVTVATGTHSIQINITTESEGKEFKIIIANNNTSNNIN